MTLGLSAATLACIMVGSFGLALAHAIRRRDPAWIMAMALPLLICADRADLPETLVAWGCALLALFAVACGIGVLLRRLGGALGLSLLAALAAMGLNDSPASAGALDLSSTSLHQPPAIGVRLEGLLHTLLAGQNAE